jgi:hypothetical protein
MTSLTLSPLLVALVIVVLNHHEVRQSSATWSTLRQTDLFFRQALTTRGMDHAHVLGWDECSVFD